MSSQLARNTVHLTVATLGQKAIAFVYFLFVARLMMPTQTGIYFLAISLATVFSVISDFGITPVVIREVAKNPKDTQMILQRVLGVKIPLLFLGYFVSVVTTFFLGYESQVFHLVFLTSFILFLDSISLLLYGVLRGQQKLSVESFGLFVGQIVSAVLGGIVLVVAPSLVLLLTALLFGSLTNVVISGTAIYKQFGASPFYPVWQKAFVLKLFRAALPFALAAIFVKVYSYIDTLFISKLLGAHEVGLYSIAYKFTYAFQFLPLAFVAALYPSFSSVIDSDRVALARMFNRAMWYMLILATPLVLGIWLIADHAVLLAGVEYRDSAPVLAVLVFVLFPIFLDFPIGSLLNAAGWQAKKTMIMGFTMLISIALNALFIPVFGIIGAAYAALISFVFMLLAGLFYVPQLIPTFRFRNLFMQFLQVGTSGLVMILVGRFLLLYMHWILLIPVCVFVYVCGLFLTQAVKREDLVSLVHILQKKI
ncbi:MAG: flippase [Patescibacteria group bacterium]